MQLSRNIHKAAIDPGKIELRQLVPEDVSDKYVGWLNDPDVNKFLEIRHSLPVTKEDVIKFVRDCRENCRYHWGIFIDGGHIGNISCSRYNRVYRWVDVSNLIGEERFRGTNAAKYALAGAIEYLFTIGNFHRIQAGTYSVHLSGIALLTNLGFKKEAVLREAAVIDNDYIDVLQFALLKNEWLDRVHKLPAVKVIRVPWE